MLLRHHKRGRRAVILIVVMWLLAGLSLLALSLAYRLRLEDRISRYRHRRHEMLEMARAAATVAKARLEYSRGNVTSCAQAWAWPLTLGEGDFGDLDAPAQRNYLIEALTFDELSKLNVNTATRNQLLRIALVDEELSGAIIDWRDEDDHPVALGAEQSYYGSLLPPALCKNAPFESISELLLVRGVTPRLFDGEGAELEASTPVSASAGLPVALEDYLTTRGDGLINLNTALPETLLAIPGLEPGTVDGIIRYRSGPDGIERTPDDGAFEEFAQLEEVAGMTEFAMGQAALYGTLRSQLFHTKVRVTDLSSGTVLRLGVDFEVTEDDVVTLTWRER